MAEEERIEIPFILENVLRYCIKDAKERMENGEAIEPFSALAAGDTLFMEEHAFDTPEECFADARHTVENARGASAYGLCYDGFVDTPQGKLDAIIAQGGVPGDEYGHAIGLLYRTDDQGHLIFEEEPIYVANCLNYMVGLTEEEDYRLDQDDDEQAEQTEESAEDSVEGV